MIESFLNLSNSDFNLYLLNAILISVIKVIQTFVWIHRENFIRIKRAPFKVIKNGILTWTKYSLSQIPFGSLKLSKKRKKNTQQKRKNKNASINLKPIKLILIHFIFDDTMKEKRKNLRNVSLNFSYILCYSSLLSNLFILKAMTFEKLKF